MADGKPIDALERDDREVDESATEGSDDMRRRDDPVEPLPGRLAPLVIAGVTVLVTAAATAFAIRPTASGGVALWAGLGIPYLLLAGYAIYLMYDEGTLVDRLSPRGGDFTMGVMVAAVLLLGSWVLRSSIAPAGSPWQGWVARIYLVLGDPSVIQRSAKLTIALLVIAGLEEITWRGMVQDALTTKLGSRRGWLVTAGLYALAVVPTAFTLRDPVAGLNPLLLVAAFACALVWGFTTRLVGRLWPTIFSHMAFIYFTAVQFHIPGLTSSPL